MKQTKTTIKSNLIYTWWFPLFVVLVVLVGTPMVILPKIDQIIAANRDLEKVETELKNAEKKVAQLNTVDEEQVKELFRDLRQALPAQKPYYEVLLLLQQLGYQTGVALGDFELKPGSVATDSAIKTTVADGKTYVKFDTEFGISGTSEQVSAFVVALHESVPLLKISSISIGKSSADDAEDRRSVALELQVLHMPDKPPVKTITYEPLPPLSESVDEVSQALAQYFNPVAEQNVSLEPISGVPRTDIFNF
jgi:Tfp pilus assembly protein PilO